MNREAKKIGETGERMVPELHKGGLIYAEHLTRYLVGQELVKDKIVLDIASGSGYGTRMLAETADKVFGVDIDKGAVEYAQKNYRAKNIEYIVGDGEKIPLADNSVDVVITYETIEHIKNYTGFMNEVSRVLRPDGLAVISTPNDLEFAEGNHYHLHEFTEQELTNLVKKHFKNVIKYYQATWKYVAIGSEKDINKEELTGMPLLNYAPVKPEEYLYFFLLCSNRKINEHVRARAALGAHYSDRYYIGLEMQHEKNIADYKQVLKEREDEGRQLRERIDALRLANEELKKKSESLNEKIQMIKRSKSYQLAARLGHMKRVLMRQHKP